MTHRLNLRAQLLLGFGIVVLLSAGVSSLAYSNTLSNRDASEWVRHSRQVIDLADETELTVEDMEVQHEHFLLSGNEAALGQYEVDVGRYQQQLDTLATLTADNPPQAARWQAIRAQIDRLRTELLEPGITLRERVLAGTASLDEVAHFNTNPEILRSRQAMDSAFEAATGVERDLLTSRVQADDAANAFLLNVLLWGTLATIALGISMAALLASSIGNPMARLALAAQAIAAGDLGRRVALHRGDEIGLAADAFDSMAAELQRDRAQRHVVDRMKDEFVSVVSHELRTPLTSIRGSLGLLQAGLLGPISTKADRMLEVALSNTNRLIRLINDILDIERIESGRATLELRPTNARDVVLRAIDSLASLHESAHVDIVNKVESLHLVADPDRLVQTLTNLLSNAIKFSPAGSSIEVSGWSDGRNARFSVRDHGRGIPPDKLESIFGRFEQVDASDSREKGGTGLGLAISRSIVLQHGGRIWVESVVDQGSTFHFTIPLPPESWPAFRQGDRPAADVRAESKV